MRFLTNLIFFFCYAPRPVHPPPPPVRPLVAPPPPVVPPPVQHENVPIPQLQEDSDDSSAAPHTPPSFEYDPLVEDPPFTTAHTTPVTTVTYASSTPISVSSQQGIPRLYPSFHSSNSSSSFSGFADSFVDKAQPILDPSPSRESIISQVPAPVDLTGPSRPIPSLPNRPFSPRGLSRIPRPVTPQPRGTSLPTCQPNLTSVSPSTACYTSTPIATQTSISLSQSSSSDIFTNTPSPPSLTPAPTITTSTTAPSTTEMLMPHLYDPYGHLALPPASSFSENLQRFYHLQHLREQEAQRLEAQAAALRNPLAARDSRLRPKPKKTGFFQSSEKLTKKPKNMSFATGLSNFLVTIAHC